jgi:hypothetical protein
MEPKKFPELKKIEKVKVRVSQNGKWLTHILSEQGLMVTFSINYYRSILKNHSEIDESALSDEQKILKRLSSIMGEINRFNYWIVKNKLDCSNLVLGQISAENEHLINREDASDLLNFISEKLNQSLDESRKENEEPI